MLAAEAVCNAESCVKQLLQATRSCSRLLKEDERELGETKMCKTPSSRRELPLSAFMPRGRPRADESASRARISLREDMSVRTVRRPRRFVDQRWLALLSPVFRYSNSRDAFLLRGIGGSVGPVLRPDRRLRQQSFHGVERRASIGENPTSQVRH
jgi:hypothetical protein